MENGEVKSDRVRLTIFHYQFSIFSFRDNQNRLTR